MVTNIREDMVDDLNFRGFCVLTRVVGAGFLEVTEGCQIFYYGFTHGTGSSETLDFGTDT